MKLIKPLIFTLFLSPAVALSAAEDTEAETPSAVPAASESTDITRVMPKPTQQRQADLALEQDIETEAIWLELNNQKQLALLQKAASASPVGSIMIFPDRDTGADWPSIVHPLRTQMTAFEWNTLSLSLPEHPPTVIPQRTLPALQARGLIQTTDTAEEVTESTEETATSTTDTTQVTTQATSQDEGQIANYNTQIIELGQLATDQLSNLDGKLTIILGIGEGATWAMHYFTQDEKQEDRFLVLLDAVQPRDDSAPNLLKMIADTEAPVLDLWFNRNQYKRQQAELRKRAALRSSNKGYQQVRLNQRSNDPRREPLWLTRQLRGILKNRILDKEPLVPALPSKAEPMVLTPGS
ncbi:DUF3530 family protein [Amphritea japonica]|uniref:DUF3530 domain-containing protein n=1 Tax=Amphritea japonica ATCC BAA-1530 TaxID=1278309 RepID=A0A7R6P892_9GAMM|nr:DUF3530 family protein [Amphritea japonica]BBB25252.1 hypothetical protein AMJAP_0653 [Amphritea japonica ATCC BAA-1530]